jgi:hypothetical protein
MSEEVEVAEKKTTMCKVFSHLNIQKVLINSGNFFGSQYELPLAGQRNTFQAFTYMSIKTCHC